MKNTLWLTTVAILTCFIHPINSAAAEPTLLDRLMAERASDTDGFEGFDTRGYDWSLRSRFWLPAEADAQTVSLLRLDTVTASKEIEQLLDSSLSPADESPDQALSIATRPRGSTTGMELRNDSPISINGSAWAQGACRLVTNGVQGGALHLAGPASRIELPDYSLKSAFTLEGWFNPEKTEGTLMHLTVGARSDALALSLTPTGQVVLTLRGEPLGLSTCRLTPGTFTHVALVYRKIVWKGHWSPYDCIVFINGTPEIWMEKEGKAVKSITTLGAPLLIGNNPANTAPFVGLIDELRLSSRSRDFYHLESLHHDPLAQRPLPKGEPVLRSNDELLLDVPLDDPQLPPDSAILSSPPPSKQPAQYTLARRSQGAVIAPQQGIRIQPTKPIPATHGSLEFWFMPYDWDNLQGVDINKPQLDYKAPIFQILTKASTQTNAQPFLTLILNRNSHNKAGYILNPLQPGSWRHAVITWQGGSVQLFIDGQAFTGLTDPNSPYSLRRDKVPPPDSEISALDFGGFKCARPLGATVIDEIKLYQHSLSSFEVANTYQRFLIDGQITPLPPAEIKIKINPIRKTIATTIDVLAPERLQTTQLALDIIKSDAPATTILTIPAIPLDSGSASIPTNHPAISYGNYLLKFALKDHTGKTLKTIEQPYAYPKPAWLDNTLGLHDGDVMPPWTPMEYQSGVISCWGREMCIGPAGWPVKITSQGQVIMPSGPDLHLVTDQGQITLLPVDPLPRLLKKQPGRIETEGIAKGGGWTMTTLLCTEFDGFMKLQTRLTGPTNAIIKELRISYPLQFADEQLFGFYTGEHWFRAAHDFRILPPMSRAGTNAVALGRAGSPLPAAITRDEKDGGQGTGRPTQTDTGAQGTGRPTQMAQTDEIVFASNKTGRQHPKEWKGKVSFLPYVTIGDDARSFVWLAENDRYWTQSWTNPAITISRSASLTKLNLNIINTPTSPTEPLTYTFGLQATPIRPLAPDFRSLQNGFGFNQVCGFNGHYMQAPLETHFSFRLSPKDLDWSHPEAEAKRYRSKNAKGTPLMIYFDRTWQRAPEDAQDYNADWRGWGGAVRYTKPVRDGYAWYINEYLRRGLMEGIYVDDAWIDPTKALHHLDPNDNLAYRKETGKPEDFSNVEWGYEFFDYREMLKRLRWLFLDNGISPRIVAHATQTPYYPVLGFVDILLEGEDRYLHAEGEKRDFITAWGLPRLRYASPQKWGIPVKWLPILSPSIELKSTGFPMGRWYFQQRRSYAAGMLLHDLTGDPQADARKAGCYADEAKFIGYWDPSNPVTPQDTNLYASVYQLPTHLALVLVNAGSTERVVNFALDLPKIKALLGTDQITLTDVDTATIPELDKNYATLKSGVSMKLMDEGVTTMEETDEALSAATDTLMETIDAAETKANDPDGAFEHHNFTFTNGILRLRIQKSDFRLLKITP